MQLEFKLDIPLHRERDRPKRIPCVWWSNWIDTICVRGGIALTESALLSDLHRCCPEHRDIKRIADLDIVAMQHWVWYWERWHSSYFHTQ